MQIDVNLSHDHLEHLVLQNQEIETICGAG